MRPIVLPARDAEARDHGETSIYGKDIFFSTTM